MLLKFCKLKLIYNRGMHVVYIVYSNSRTLMLCLYLPYFDYYPLAFHFCGMGKSIGIKWLVLRNTRAKKGNFYSVDSRNTGITFVLIGFMLGCVDF